MVTRYRLDSGAYGRVFTLIDGVYAIALTILVFNIRLDDHSAWRSFTALVTSELPTRLFGFTLCFVVIAALWRINHRVVARFHSISSPVMAANFAALFFVALLPFSVEGVSDPDLVGLALPTAAFACNVALASFFEFLIWPLSVWTGDVRKHDGLFVEASRALFRLGIPIVFGLSIPVALSYGPEPARNVWLLCIPLAVAGALLLKSRRGRAALAEDQGTHAPRSVRTAR